MHAKSLQSGPTLCSPMDCSLLCRLCRLLCPWDSSGKNTGVGCHVLLQGIFLTQKSNLGLPPLSPALQAHSLPLSHQGSPLTLAWEKNNQPIRDCTKTDTTDYLSFLFSSHFVLYPLFSKIRTFIGKRYYELIFRCNKEDNVIGTVSYTLLCIEQTEDQLYSTGNSTQCSVVP